MAKATKPPKTNETPFFPEVNNNDPLGKTICAQPGTPFQPDVSLYPDECGIQMLPPISGYIDGGMIKNAIKMALKEYEQENQPKAELMAVREEVCRYFLNATITAFADRGYEELTISGVNVLSTEELDDMDKTVRERFTEEINEWVLKIFKQEIKPSMLKIRINALNRLH